MKYGLNIIIIFYFMDFICYSLFIMVFLWHIIKIRMTKSDKKILEGAFRLFLNADYEGASTSDLEAEIGLTRGAIYYSYKSKEELFKAGYEMKQMEGYREGNWILLDFGDIIIHIFDKENRLFYDLERIWKDGKEVSIEELN